MMMMMAQAQDAHLRGRLLQAVACIMSAHISSDLALLQVWLPALHQEGLDALQKQLYTDPELCIMGCAALSPFRLSSCQSMQYGHQGMPGRVLRSGCVQVVQNLRIIPAVLHPRCRLPDALAGEVGEVVYVPVYDTQRPHAGPVAVLEALLSARASDSMMVASFISVAGSVLASLQLSLSNPLPQPVCRSKLEGRKPRPVHDDSAGDLTAAAFQQCHKQQQPAEGAAAGVTAFAQHPCSPVSASPEQQQQQACSPSSGSAGTLLAGSSAGIGGAFTSAAAASVDCTLTSTLSSRPSDISAVVPAELPGSPGSTAMLPPRAMAAGRPQQQHQHRRQRQHDDGSDGTDGSACGDASPRPCKLRRSLSMVRTKSVSAGLDQVLAQAGAPCLPTASC